MTGLKEGALYRFRVRAVNLAGIGEPGEVTDAIEMKDRIGNSYLYYFCINLCFGLELQIALTVVRCFPVSPDLQLDASVRDRIVVHAGGVIRIIAYVSGKPPPTVTWNMNEKALPPEANIETTAISSSMVIKNCQRSHQGVYSLLAKNEGGERKKTIIVDVLGKYFQSVQATSR